MDNLFNNILVNLSEDITVGGALVTMLAALILGFIVAFTYYKTADEEYYQRSMSITLLMLPIVLSAVIVFIGNNIARAFSLAGTLSIIRFRSAPGDPKDIGFIFFDIAAGLACGVGLYAYGLMFTAVLCIILVIAEKCNIFGGRKICKQLKITIPEDLNYDGVFDDILDVYTTKHKLTKIRTTDLGSLFELCYSITMDETKNEQEFLNEIRCRNGNLSIILSVIPPVVIK